MWKSQSPRSYLRGRSGLSRRNTEGWAPYIVVSLQMEINRIGVIITNTVYFPSVAAVPIVFNSINTYSREFLFDYSIDDFILKLLIIFLKLYIMKPT